MMPITQNAVKLQGLLMDKEYQLNRISLIYLCDACLDGLGGECHTAGCALWMSTAPDVPIRDSVKIEYQIYP